MGNGECDPRTLPDDVILHIMQYLDFRSLVRAGVSCVRWHLVAQSNSLWKNLFLQTYQLPASTQLREGDDNEEISWYGEMKRLHWQTPLHLSDQLCSHHDEVLHVSFSPDGRYFATSSKDAWIKVWRVSSLSGSSTESEVAATHPDQVGEASSSTSETPPPQSECQLAMQLDMHQKLKWRYTQFSQFNADSSLLLVSGVQCNYTSTSGECAVFAIDEENSRLSFRCRVHNVPYDVFGCWFDNNHLLSGDFYRLAGINFAGASMSSIWLCKASQDTHTERTAVMAPMYKFLNSDEGANLRMLVCSGHVTERTRELLLMRELLLSQRKRLLDPNNELHDHLSIEALTEMPLRDWNKVLYGDQQPGARRCYNCAQNHKTVTPTTADSQPKASGSADLFDDSDDDEDFGCECICHGTINDRLLMFTTGNRSYVPHLVAFKLVNTEQVLSRLDADILPPARRAKIMARFNRIRELKLSASVGAVDEQHLGLNLPVPFAQHEEEFNIEQEEADRLREADVQMDVDTSDDDGEPPEIQVQVPPDAPEPVRQRLFDEPDHLIDMEGHIVGMSLTHCKRYLLVNVRPWVFTEENVDRVFVAWDPPPISEEIIVRVIDLEQLRLLDATFRQHRGFTTNDQCFFIFLDGNDRLIASGSEDARGCLWSRDYGVFLGSLPHKEVVNCVAISPTDPELAVTVSDDHSIHLWRSKRQMQIRRSRVELESGHVKEEAPASEQSQSTDIHK